MPTLSVLAFLAAWEIALRALQIPIYLLPVPLLIAITLAESLASAQGLGSVVPPNLANIAR